MKIGWLPGDGIGGEVLEMAKIVLNVANLDADYFHGDIGWEFWKTEGKEKLGQTYFSRRNPSCDLGEGYGRVLIP